MQISDKFKRISMLVTFLFSVSYGFTQSNAVEVSHYLFPEFTKGVVLMRSGIRNDALLNYNAITEEMIFDTNGKKLALTQLELVDSVYINGRKFIPFRGNFLEVIYQSKYELLAEHKCSVKDTGKPAGYGGTSQTSATSTIASYLSGNRVYDMKLPVGYETKPYVEYWLKKDGVENKFINIRQLTKLFDDKASIVKKYMKSHSVKYNNQESIVELLKYLVIK